MHNTSDQASRYSAMSLKSCIAAKQGAQVAKTSQVPILCTRGHVMSFTHTSGFIDALVRLLIYNYLNTCTF